MFRQIGGIAADLVAAAALEKHRRGEPVTLADKIMTLASAEEIEGFVDEVRRQGVPLSDEERAALWSRIDALTPRRGAGRVASRAG